LMARTEARWCRVRRGEPDRARRDVLNQRASAPTPISTGQQSVSA
jgi:hypothetical protein